MSALVNNLCHFSVILIFLFQYQWNIVSKTLSSTQSYLQIGLVIKNEKKKKSQEKQPHQLEFCIWCAQIEKEINISKQHSVWILS